MEKVLRICEMTGRYTVVAENLTPEQAMELIRERHKTDNFLVTWLRVKQ